MHCSELLSNYMKDVCPKMHITRRESLKALIDSCLRSEKAYVTGLGRNISSIAKEKNNIKRADRLLSNKHMHKEVLEAYKNLCRNVLFKDSNPTILVDWSNLDKGKKFYLLRASVAATGRSLTLYEEVHALETKEKPSTHKAFLKTLSSILPGGVIPTIVTDAGFRIPWFQQVEALGWNWVGRIRGQTHVKLEGKDQWIDGRDLHLQATSNAKSFCGSVGRDKDFNCNLVLYKAKAKGRSLLNAFGVRRKANRSKQAQARAKEPWLLATSLHSSPKHIVSLYAARMQIEESFRDTKSKHYGIGLSYSRSYKINRIKVLVLLTTLANTFAWLLGKTSENLKKHFDFQANTINAHRVLSFVFLGIKVFKKKQCFLIYYKDFIEALSQTRRLVSCSN